MTNYGKFTTIWDRIMGSYWDPDRINYGWSEQEVRLRKFEAFNELYNKICKDTSSITDKKNKKFN